MQPEVKFLDEIRVKVLRVVLTAIHRHLYSSTASSSMVKYLRISSYIRKPFLVYDFATDPIWTSLYIYCRRKISFSFYWCDRKPYPLLYGLRNPCRYLNSENPQDDAQKPQVSTMLYVHESGFWIRRAAVGRTENVGVIYNRAIVKRGNMTLRSIGIFNCISTAVFLDAIIFSQSYYHFYPNYSWCNYSEYYYVAKATP